MDWRVILALAVLPHAGCGRGPVEQPPMSDRPDQSPRAEIRIGESDDPTRRMVFKITGMHQDRKPTAEAPYHAEGGKWTFLDCRTESGPEVAFTVGVLSKGGDGKVPITWGDAILIVKDRESGARFVEAFGRAFSGEIPTTAGRAHVPRPLPIKTAVLGDDMNRDETGGFSGQGGGWTATKWFPAHDGRQGEVYFNYNLTERRCDFSEKDPDYGDDLVAVFASALRDGPRPERTPDNDPNLTRTGPSIGDPRKVLPRLASSFSLSPEGHHAVYQDGPVIMAVPIGPAGEAPREIARFDHSPWEFRVVDEDLDLIARECVPGTPGIRSSADPMRIWWVDGKTRGKTLLRGPEKDLNLAEVASSPDHRYVALEQWREKPGGRGRTEILLILEREGGGAKEFAVQGEDLSLVGWRQTETGLRAVAVTNRWRFDGEGVSVSYLADPATGTLERRDDIDGRLEIDNPLSPDGKRRVRVGEEELIVTDLEGGRQRRFVFHEDDRQYIESECIEWAGPRYLKFNGPRLALIDVDTMKMSYPSVAGGASIDSHSCQFSPDFGWVLYHGSGSDGDGLFLAPVKMPERP
jgi:hypothetical protein